MSNALITLRQIAANATEYAHAARTDGFDGAEALKEIEDAAELASKRIAGIPVNSNVLVAAILMQDDVCEDVLDMAENGIDMLLRDRQPAHAVRRKLQAFVDLYGAPDSETSAHAASSAEDAAWDRCMDLIDRIDLVHPEARTLHCA